MIEGADFVNRPGAELDVQSNFSISAGASPGSFVNEGSFRKTAGTGTTPVAVPFVNSGVVDLMSGTVALTNSFDHTGGVIQGSATLDLSGATVGTFTGDVNPGTSPGILTITGVVRPEDISATNIVKHTQRLNERRITRGEEPIVEQSLVHAGPGKGGRHHVFEGLEYIVGA